MMPCVNRCPILLDQKIHTDIFPSSNPFCEMQWKPSPCSPILIHKDIFFFLAFLHLSLNFDTRKVCKASQKGPLFAEYSQTLIKYRLCRCSSSIAGLTNGPLSLRNPPPSDTTTNWILNIRGEDGGKAAVLSNLHRINCSC